MAATWSHGRGLALQLVAALEGALAAGFLLATFISGLWFLLIPAAVLLGVAVLLLFIKGRLDKASRKRQRLLQSGLNATAIITSMQQTAVMFNGQPEVILNLSVTVGARTPYPLRVKEFVPMIYMGRLTDGRPLVLKVDPDNPQRIAIDWGRVPE